MDNNRIALQLYTVRQHTAEDMLGTLRQVAAMGYRAVEFAGYGNASVGDVHAALDEYGLKGVGAHVGLDRLERELGSVVSELHTLGCEFVVLPSMPEERRDTPKSVRQTAQRFNGLGEACRNEGLRFAYHNHDAEFEPMEQGMMLDLLLAETDPSLVSLELDVYWAEYAGAGTVDLINRYASRISLLHVKDLADGPERRDAPVGEGTIAWEPLLAAAGNAGVRWYITEQDEPADALEDARTSLHNLEHMAIPPA